MMIVQSSAGNVWDMKVADLPPDVIDDLNRSERGWLDIELGFNSKHEFWQAWRRFLVQDSLDDEIELAEFLNFDGFNVLLPVPRNHHPYIRLIRLIPSSDKKTLTIFLHDSFHQNWFNDQHGARYGFLAVADRYEKFSCDFYLANYYHFSYLINGDYEEAKRIMAQRTSSES